MPKSSSSGSRASGKPGCEQQSLEPVQPEQRELSKPHVQLRLATAREADLNNHANQMNRQQRRDSTPAATVSNHTYARLLTHIFTLFHFSSISQLSLTFAISDGIAKKFMACFSSSVRCLSRIRRRTEQVMTTMKATCEFRCRHSDNCCLRSAFASPTAMPESKSSSASGNQASNQASNDNTSNQCNPNNANYQGHTSSYGGDGTQANADNHANQMNPNNSAHASSRGAQ
jgi:hypothetical protein